MIKKERKPLTAHVCVHDITILLTDGFVFVLKVPPGIFWTETNDKFFGNEI